MRSSLPGTNPLAAESTGTDAGGLPVVLVHGLTFRRAVWTPLRAELTGRRVLAVDLPGHGDSPEWERYDLAEVADAVHGAIVAAGFEDPILVGHSIGAVVATVCAARHPVRAVVNVDQSLLAGPFADFLRSARDRLRGPEYRKVWDQLVEGMGIAEISAERRGFLHSAPSSALLLGYWRELLETPADELRARREAELAALRAAGTAYCYVSRAEPNPAYAAWLAAALPAAESVVVPGSGHFPHVGQPEKLADIVARLSLPGEGDLDVIRISSADFNVP